MRAYVLQCAMRLSHLQPQRQVVLVNAQLHKLLVGA